MEQEEIWKNVVGYEDYFKVSNLGNVFSKRSGKILKMYINPYGYRVVSTRIGGRYGKCLCFKIHRLVADAFLECPSEYQIQKSQETFYKKVLVNHKDGNKLNNCSTNLEWCTYKENSEHAIISGLFDPKANIGLDNKLFSLTSEQVDFIIKNYISHDRQFGARALARKFGVGRGCVDRAVELYINKN